VGKEVTRRGKRFLPISKESFEMRERSRCFVPSPNYRRGRVREHGKKRSELGVRKGWWKGKVHRFKSGEKKVDTCENANAARHVRMWDLQKKRASPEGGVGK